MMSCRTWCQQVAPQWSDKQKAQSFCLLVKSGRVPGINRRVSECCTVSGCLTMALNKQTNKQTNKPVPADSVKLFVVSVQKFARLDIFSTENRVGFNLFQPILSSTTNLTCLVERLSRQRSTNHPSNTRYAPSPTPSEGSVHSENGFDVTHPGQKGTE